MQPPSTDRDRDLVLAGLFVLGAIGLGSLALGVLWPSALDGRLLVVGAAAVVVSIIGVHLVLAGLAADRGRTLDREREFDRRHASAARER
jgi:hypothetical protein